MSGHSKWSKIKGAKGAADQKRGKIFPEIIERNLYGCKKQRSGSLMSEPALNDR